MLDNSGIYAIVNSVTGDYYIGSALTLRKRRNSHFHALRKGKHDSIYLQRAWAKYGSEAFYFRPFIVCRPADLIYFEQRAIDALKPRYNMAPKAGNCLGTKRSAEAKAKMRLAKLGKKQDPIDVEARAAKLRGVKRGPLTAEHRAKIQRANKGHTPPNKGKRGPSPPNKGTGHQFQGLTVPQWTVALKLGKNTLYERMRREGLTLQQAVFYGR